MCNDLIKISLSNAILNGPKPLANLIKCPSMWYPCVFSYAQPTYYINLFKYVKLKKFTISLLRKSNGHATVDSEGLEPQEE